MAKQLVGPVERHLDKAILGLACLALVGAVIQYGVSSPNRIDLGGEMVSPSNIDQVILRKSDTVRERIRNARAEVDIPEPLFERFVEELTPFRADGIRRELALAAQFGPLVPLIDPPDTKLGEAELVEVYRLPKPSVTWGRSTFVQFNAQEEATYLVGNWATVTAVFDREEQMKRQIDAYGATRKDVIFGSVELQRRARRADGSWSDDDWGMVDTFAAEEIPPQPVIEFTTVDGVTQVPRRMGDKVRDFRLAMEEPLLQLDLLRPLMPDVYNGDAWKFAILTSYDDVLWQDDEYLFPDEKSETPDDRYGLNVRVDESEEEQLTKEQRINRTLKEIEALIAEAIAKNDDDLAIQANNMAVEVEANDDASPQQKSKAERLWKKASQTEMDIERTQRDIKRRKTYGRRPTHGTGDSQEEQEREISPIQQIWAHDARPESIGGGKTYQYRMRALLYNRLVGEPRMVLNDDDAKTLFIPGEWSEPSDPIYVESTSYYYVTAMDRRDNEVKIELYQWYEGYWVTRRFDFAIGQPVARMGRCPIPVRDDPDDIDNAQVEFDMGVTVADIHASRPHRERKEKRGGVKFGPNRSAEISVVLVDDAGRLYERIITIDKNSPEKKAVAERVWKKKGR